MNDQRNTGVDAPDDERTGSEHSGDGPGAGSTETGGAKTGGAQSGGADSSGRASASEAPGAGNPAGVTAGNDVETLRRQKDEYYDLLLRKTAEFDNYRRRVERERRELSEFASADLLRDVLPVLDDLELALAAAPDAREAQDPAAALQGYRTGVELIHRQLQELLRKKGVTPIEAVGAIFDPHVHQAVTQEPSATHRDGEVIAELRRGYKLGDRLLRPAMVKVATRE